MMRLTKPPRPRVFPARPSDGDVASVTGRVGWLLPPDATDDARWLIAARGLRAFGDGLVSVLLPTYLLDRGFDVFSVGVLSTLTLLGSAALTLGVRAVTNRLGHR